jgi:hypothetical protein
MFMSRLVSFVRTETFVFLLGFQDKNIYIYTMTRFLLLLSPFIFLFFPPRLRCFAYPAGPLLGTLPLVSANAETVILLRLYNTILGTQVYSFLKRAALNVVGY